MPGKIAKEGQSELDIEVSAKCPKCGRVRKVIMPWTGRGMPRKFCRRCLHYKGLEQIATIDDHGPPHLSRWARLGWV